MTKKTRPIRPLHNFELVEQFLENALLLDLEQSENYALVPKIVSIHFGKWFWDKSKNGVPLDIKTYEL